LRGRASRRLCLPLAVLAIFSIASASGSANESAEDLFPNAGVEHVRVSPDGSWVSARGQRGVLAAILVQRVESAQISNVLVTEDIVWDLTWVDRRTLIAEIYASSGRRFMLIRFGYVDGEITQDKTFMSAPGWLIDPLPLVDDEVLWAFNASGRALLHRANLEDLENFGEARTRRGRALLPGESLANIAGIATLWVVDRDGKPRAVRRVNLNNDGEVESYAILFRKEGETSFVAIHSYGVYDDEDELTPVTLTSDGKSLIVIAYNGKNTRGVHVFHPETGEFGETLFVRPDVDVTDVQFDPYSYQIFSAVYEVNGEQRHHYLASYGQDMLMQLGDEIAKESARVVDISADRQLFVFRVSDAMNPGAFYIRDVANNLTVRVAQSGSNIDLDALSAVTSIVVNSDDGTKIEAFLTLPKSNASRPVPLIVMPHGGPIDVRDNRVYDPVVQYFASWGFAVIQPNYRGSAGYGLAFMKSGKKQWAEGIEDDIDAAVEYAMALPEIDGSRICIVGASYGGFSALASIVRHKKRYACAVSWNGVSDIPMLYESSDIADSKNSLAFYTEFVGDLETGREKLIEASPAYHADEIETPVFFVFGTEDRRVDPDHSHRMMLMLELYGKAFDSLEVKGMAHGTTRREGIIVARAIRRYISQYLESGDRYVRDPIGRTEDSNDFIEVPKVDF
jgi:dipeptidyl aminopeptidase/acylaminoacyl peptidase